MLRSGLASMIAAAWMLTASAAAWDPAVGSFEHAGSDRTGLFAAASPFAASVGEPAGRKVAELPGVWSAALDSQGRVFVLGEAYRTISGYLLKAVGVTRSTGATGAVTLIQRFASALNLNLHFHMIFLDGVYLPAGDGPPVFRPVPAPTTALLQGLVQRIAERVGSKLAGRGLIERDMDNAWLTADGEGGPLDDLIGHSITYRIAAGPRAGQKLFTLQTLSASAMPVPCRVRTAQPTARSHHAGWSGQGQGAGGHREDPGAPGTHGAGSASSRAAARGEGAAGADPAAVNPGDRGVCRGSGQGWGGQIP